MWMKTVHTHEKHTDGRWAQKVWCSVPWHVLGKLRWNDKSTDDTLLIDLRSDKLPTSSLSRIAQLCAQELHHFRGLLRRSVLLYGTISSSVESPPPPPTKPANPPTNPQEGPQPNQTTRRKASRMNQRSQRCGNYQPPPPLNYGHWHCTCVHLLSSRIVLYVVQQLCV